MNAVLKYEQVTIHALKLNDMYVAVNLHALWMDMQQMYTYKQLIVRGVHTSNRLRHVFSIVNE